MKPAADSIHQRVKAEAARAAVRLDRPYPDEYPELFALMRFARAHVSAATASRRVRSMQYHGKRYPISQTCLWLRVHDPESGQIMALGLPES